MKKAFAAVCLSLVWYASPVLHAEGIKIGFVDAKKILEGSRELQLINKHSKELMDGYNQFVEEQNALMSNATEEERRTIDLKIEEQKKKMDAGLNINSKKYLSYIERIRDIVKALASELKLDLVVLNQDLLLLTGDYADMTGTVLTKINETKD